MSGKVLRDVLFARGLTRQDADRFRRAITACHRPIVLVGVEIPPADFWQGRVHTVVALSQLAHLRNGQIELELEAVVAAVREAESEANTGDVTVIDENRFKVMIRRQVKAERKSELTDDMVVAAYVTHGSSRAAAEALAKDGHSIHFSTVTRRVNRAKKAIALQRGESSESVVRSVASQRRNKAKQIRNTPEAKDFQ